MATTYELGAFVSHDKLPELGNGEVVACEKGTVRVRFATAEKTFLVELVAQHLSPSAEGPKARPKATRKARAKTKAK